MTGRAIKHSSAHGWIQPQHWEFSDATGTSEARCQSITFFGHAIKEEIMCLKSQAGRDGVDDVETETHNFKRFETLKT